MNKASLNSIKTAWSSLLIALALITGHPANAATLTTENIIITGDGRSESSNAIGVVFGAIVNKQIAQSITTTIGGSLDSIAVDIVQGTQTNDDLILSIYSAVGDFPDALLGSVTESQSSFPFGVGSPTTIDFSSQGITLSPNTKYVITASVTNPLINWQYLWRTSLDSGYVDGDASFNNGGSGDLWQPLPAHHDLVFGVYVNPIPIPPALWLFGSGLLGLVGMARGKKA